MKDPEGRSALFSVSNPPESSKVSGEEIAFEAAEGREALFSAAGRRPGKVTLTCERCTRVSRVDFVEFVKMHIPLHLWFPWKPYSRWLVCPACEHRAWLRVKFFS